MAENNSDKEVRHLAFSDRETRQVPLDWRHPVDPNDGSGFKPLLPREHLTDEEYKEHLEDDPTLTREEFESWYMPDFSKVPTEKMGICAYESTTEGTPISPVFPNTPEGRFELAKHCMDNATVFAGYKSGIEAWCAILFGKGLAVVDMKSGRVETPLSRQDKAGNQ